MNTLKKFSLWTAFPLMLLGIATRSLADAPLNVEAIANQIRQQTQVPIFLPSQIPGLDEIYVNVDADSNGYYLSFDYTSDCQGATACNFGGLSAEQGGQLIQAEDVGAKDILESVQLVDGTEAQFANTCGAYCTAMVVWQIDNVLYSAYIKNGRKEDVMELANLTLAGAQ